MLIFRRWIETICVPLLLGSILWWVVGHFMGGAGMAALFIGGVSWLAYESRRK
jgi:hypothetical protein